MNEIDTRLAEIERREQAATPGPWEMFRYSNGGGRIHLSGDDGRERTLIADMWATSITTAYNEGDREFLLSAREDIPWLLSQLRDARAENERLREAASTWTKNALQAEAKVRAVEAALAAVRDDIDRRRPCANCRHRASLHNVGYWGCSACECGAFGEPEVALEVKAREERDAPKRAKCDCTACEIGPHDAPIARTHDDPACCATSCSLDHGAIREEMRSSREQPIERWAFDKLQAAVTRHEFHYHDCQTTWCTTRFIFDSSEWTEILADAYERGTADAALAAAEQDEPKRTCGFNVGDSGPCRCLLPRSHAGLHQCEHTLAPVSQPTEGATE